MSAVPILKGRAPLVPVEQAARDTGCAWIGDAGWLQGKGGMPVMDEEDPLSLARGLIVAIAIMVPLWVAFVFWVIS